jgi:hypothetical protein
LALAFWMHESAANNGSFFVSVSITKSRAARSRPASQKNIVLTQLDTPIKRCVAGLHALPILQGK